MTDSPIIAGRIGGPAKGNHPPPVARESFHFLKIGDQVFVDRDGEWVLAETVPERGEALLAWVDEIEFAPVVMRWPLRRRA